MQLTHDQRFSIDVNDLAEIFTVGRYISARNKLKVHLKWMSHAADIDDTSMRDMSHFDFLMVQYVPVKLIVF